MSSRLGAKSTRRLGAKSTSRRKKTAALLLVHNWWEHSVWEAGRQASAYWLALLVAVSTWEQQAGGGVGGAGGVDRRAVVSVELTMFHAVFLACYATNRRRRRFAAAARADHVGRENMLEWATGDDVALMVLGLAQRNKDSEAKGL